MLLDGAVGWGGGTETGPHGSEEQMPRFLGVISVLGTATPRHHDVLGRLDPEEASFGKGLSVSFYYFLPRHTSLSSLRAQVGDPERQAKGGVSGALWSNEDSILRMLG